MTTDHRVTVFHYDGLLMEELGAFPLKDQAAEASALLRSITYEIRAIGQRQSQRYAASLYSPTMGSVFRGETECRSA